MIAQHANQQNAKNIRVLEAEILQHLDKRYETRTNGTNRMLLFALRVEKFLLEEIRGTFTPDEIKAMVDNENGTLIDERYWGYKRMFLFSLEDGFELSGLGDKWNAHFEEIREKVNILSDAAFLLLHELIYRFWNERPAHGAPAPDLEQFVELFKKNNP